MSHLAPAWAASSHSAEHLEARADPELLIIAHTDAGAEFGLAEACRRARLYNGTGADVTSVEAPQSERDIELVTAEIRRPKMLNPVQGRKTPALPLERAQELGFSTLLCANLSQLAGIYAVHGVLDPLKHSRSHHRTGDRGLVGAASGGAYAPLQQHEPPLRDRQPDGRGAELGRDHGQRPAIGKRQRPGPAAAGRQEWTTMQGFEFGCTQDRRARRC
ncbi:isocitrate lyase/phosphoenolpyruvate mutase family protein, partial [Streptomyces sp. NPDC058171]